MDLREVIKKYKQFKIPSLSIVCKKASQYSKTCLLAIIILFIVFVYLVQQIPHWQVAQFGIMNPKDIADAENSYRATLAQIFGGIAIAIGLYYTWRRIAIAEEDLKVTKDNLQVAQEGQITERFTRAVDQLGATDKDGNPAIEIRLGGIYALERIASESKKDHWPIMEILTAYVRKNSSVKVIGIGNDKPISMDVQAILTVLGRCKIFSSLEETDPVDLLNELDLQATYLRKANLFMANFNKADLRNSHLEGAFLIGIYLKQAFLFDANLKGADLTMSHLEYAQFVGADLEGAHLYQANLKGAHLYQANLKGTNLERANLQGANLQGANLQGAKNLTVDQLLNVKTLYQAKLDPELEEELRSKGYSHLLDDEP